MTNVVLAGNAVTAEILYQYLEADSRYQVIATTVDDEFAQENGIAGLETLPLSELPAMISKDDCKVMMASGYAGLGQPRENLYTRISSLGYTIATYIHPDAKVYSKKPIGRGSVILANTVIEPHATIGENTFIWCNATIAHHSKVGSHCWIASGSVLAGNSSIGNNVFVGVNATIVDELNVGDYSIIGGGSLITQNVKASSVLLARSAEALRFTAQEYDKHFGI